MSMTASTTVHAASSRVSGDAWLHRFAILVSVFTFSLILAGSLVTTHHAGLAVPDWPTTYGDNMFTFPPSQWVGGIRYEHLHRLIGAVAGLLTLILCGWLWMSRHRRRLKWLGTVALLTVCLQGLLGGLTVWYLLPTWLSVAHAGLAEIFFCISVSLAALTSPGWEGTFGEEEVGETPSGREDPPIKSAQANACGSSRVEAPSRLRRLCVVVLLVVYVQILLGALMRHTQSESAITDFPLAYGGLWPATSATALEGIDIDRVWELDLEPVTGTQIWIHFSHRIGAVAVAVVVVVLVRRVLSRVGRRKELVKPAMILGGLLVLQFVLGAQTIWSAGSAAVTTAHIGGGALMLATSWMLVLRTWPSSELSQSRRL